MDANELPLLSVPWNVALSVLTRDRMMSSFYEFLGPSCFFSVTSHRHFILRDTSHYSSRESSQKYIGHFAVHISHADSYPDTSRISCVVVTKKCQSRGSTNSVLLPFYHPSRLMVTRARGHLSQLRTSTTSSRMSCWHRIFSTVFRALPLS